MTDAVNCGECGTGNPVGAHFCSKCGSTVSGINNDKFPGHIYVAKGNISSHFDIPAEIQVFTKYKADWVTIDESIPVIN